MLSDAHAHGDDYQPQELETALQRATQKGLSAIVVLGTTMATSEKAVAISQSHGLLWAGVGLHPWWPQAVDASTYARLKELARSKRVVCIGEVGLDLVRDPSGIETQKVMFRSQVRLAKELALPLNIHCGRAYLETLEILRQERPLPKAGLMHNFRGDLATMHEYLDMGFFISLGRTALQPEGDALQVIREVPLERLLTETDSSGASSRDSGYDPTSVAQVAEKVAEIRGLKPEALGDQATRNLRQLMGI